jgi:hypothetical protein
MIISHGTLTTRELPSGLSKVTISKNGKGRVRCYGFVVIVRTLQASFLRCSDEEPPWQLDVERAFSGTYASSRLFED